MAEKTNVMARIDLTWVKDANVSLFYTSHRLGGTECVPFQKTTKKDDTWLMDADFIINEFGEIPSINVMIDNVFFKINCVVSHNGDQCKYWLEKIN